MNKPSEVKKHHCQQQQQNRGQKERSDQDNKAAKHCNEILYYNFLSEKLDHLKIRQPFKSVKCFY